MKKLKMDWNEALDKRLNGLNELLSFDYKHIKFQPYTKRRRRSTMAKRLKSENLWLGTWWFYSTLGYACFWAKSSPSGLGPFLITKVFPHGSAELENNEGAKFTVNGQRTKIYLGHAESVHDVVEAYRLDEVQVIKDLVSCRDIKSRASWEETQGVSSSQQ